MKVYKIKKLKKQGSVKVNYKEELNKEQYKVVTEAAGPCLVLAGAGSGKTRTIVYRVAYLLEMGIPAQNILLLTFTNKAAREMMARIEILLKSHSKGLWAGTFHHIANRILRKYATKLGYKSNFNILDSEDAKILLKVCIRDLGIDLRKRRFPSPAVLKNIISYHINSQKPLIEVIEVRNSQWVDWQDKISEITKLYKKRKKQNNLMDFDDLLLNLLRLLKENKDIKERLAFQFQYILVDEYQDTNYLQANIVKLLASEHNNVLVVGDDAQSIYGFRAADIGNILNFPKLFAKTKIFKLETNYRSTPDILDLANDIISNNVNQYPKVLKSIQAKFIKPQLVPCTSPKQEAEFIASMILQAQDEGLPLNKMAVLFRATHHSQTLEMELNKRDIPYDYRGGLRFFARSHIKDVVAYLRLLNNIGDEISWMRVLNLQIGIGSATVEKILTKIKTGKFKRFVDLADFNMDNLLNSQALVGWKKLQKTIKQIAKVKDQNDVAGLIRTIAKSDYQDYLIAQFSDATQRLDDLEQFALYAAGYDSIKKFIDEVTLQEGFGVNKGKVDYSEEERLILTTIHQAKGLEWESVFIMNLVETGLPNQRALQEVNGLEEERRLFYVATTRAQKQLFLTYPIVGGFDGYLNQMSQFLLELDQRKLAKARIEEDYDDGEIVIKIDEDGNRSSYLPKIEDL